MTIALFGDRAGGIAVSFAMALPVLLAMAGLASDYAVMTKLRSDLQHVADAAAAAAAHEIPLAHKNVTVMRNAARNYAAFALRDEGGRSGASGKMPDNISIESEVVEDFSAVKVTVRENWTPFFAHFLAKGITPVIATATARYVGSTNICVLGLSPSLVAGVQLWNNARLTGNNCAVYSNTNSSAGLNVLDSGMLKTSLNCVVGGYQISSALSVDPTPISDCPPLDDPLKDRPAPSVGGCDYSSLTILGQTRTLNPGVYCGGIKILGTSDITLTPGIYVIKDGPLLVSGSTSFTGDGVGFYMTGDSSVAWFTAPTTISLSAPVDGPLAGLLFFEDRSVSGLRIHRIASNNARKLLGTIYVSKSILNIDSAGPVADQSAYTAIIAQSLQLQSGPNLILNSDYAATNVPVPEGIRGQAQVILSQ